MWHLHNKFQNFVKMTIRDQPVDICICLDTSISNGPVHEANIQTVADIAFMIKTSNRRADIRYGAVVFRDPVDWRPEKPSISIDQETKMMIKNAREEYLKKEDKRDEDIEKQREEDKKCIDTKKYPHDKNVSIEFTRSMEKKSRMRRWP